MKIVPNHRHYNPAKPERQEMGEILKKDLDLNKKAGYNNPAVREDRNIMTCSGIEVVITSTIGNRVAV